MLERPKTVAMKLAKQFVKTLLGKSRAGVSITRLAKAGMCSEEKRVRITENQNAFVSRIRRIVYNPIDKRELVQRTRSSISPFLSCKQNPCFSSEKQKFSNLLVVRFTGIAI